MPRLGSIFPKLPNRIKGLPTSVILIIGLLIIINAVTWAATGIVLHFHGYLITPAVISYTLGLRHALDADHITAIDLMTRRLIASGQRPVTVGTFFSLGHSTIVIITCIVVAATSGALRDRFDNFQYVGGIIGTSVSAAVLLLLCAANIWILVRLVKRLKAALAQQRAARRRAQLGEAEEADAETAEEPGVDADAVAGTSPAAEAQYAGGHLDFEGAGVMATIFRRLFSIVDRPWKMYPIGVLFGLGFDTSSEVSLLALTSLQGSQGTSIWLILIFPILFTGETCSLPGFE
jgi:nickel/cobalt transporter (NiCoT) family protein